MHRYGFSGLMKRLDGVGAFTYSFFSDRLHCHERMGVCARIFQAHRNTAHGLEPATDHGQRYASTKQSVIRGRDVALGRF